MGVYLYSRDYKDRDELQGSRDFHVNYGALYLVRINILFKSLSEYFNAHICAKNIVPPLTGEGLWYSVLFIVSVTLSTGILGQKCFSSCFLKNKEL